MASSVIHIVKLPRRRRPAPYPAQFVTVNFILGMWCRRSALNLFGMQENRFVSRDAASYRARRVSVHQRPDRIHSELLEWTGIIKQANLSIEE
jgi:hypothetical protein